MVNKAFIIGNLGKDPDLRFTPNGRALAKFPVATTETWKGKDGQKQESTTWLNVVVWGPLAENCGKYLSKGRQVFIEGGIRTRSYEDKGGNKRWITEIVAREVKFLGGQGRYEVEDTHREVEPEDYGHDAPEDDIPF